MTTAFVLSGGGSLGAVQAGMLVALAEAGVRPDLLVGSSVGALNAGFVAGRPWPDGAELLADLWTRVRRSDVFPLRVDRLASALAGRSAHLFPDTGLVRLIDQHLTYDQIERSRIPLAVVATEVLTGRERVMSDGDVRPAVLASAALPGIFPLVTVDGTPMMDGGLVNNTPISAAIDLGADEIYVLPTGYACALERPPTSASATALHAVTVAIQRRLIDDVRTLRDRTRLRVAPPLCPVAVSPADFRHAAMLIERARNATARWLRTPYETDPSAHLALHAHSARTRHRATQHLDVQKSPAAVPCDVPSSHPLQTESQR